MFVRDFSSWQSDLQGLRPRRAVRGRVQLTCTSEVTDGAKVSGTLIESHRLIRSTDVDRWSAEALVVGIGVNVAHYPTEGLIYPATSLRQQDRRSSAIQVIRDLASALIEALEIWRQRGFAPIRVAYLKNVTRSG